MGSTWQDNSEVVLGLILENRISLNLFRPEIFCTPYDDAVKLLKSGVSTPEELVHRLGLAPIQAAHEAAKMVNGLGDMNWLSILETSAVECDAGLRLERLGKKLQRGDAINWSELNSISKRAQEGISGDFTPLSDVKDEEINFVPTGWLPWDENLCGLPEVGLTLVGGNPGDGKTTLMAKMAAKFAKTNPTKNVAVFSIEMVLKEIAKRIREVDNVDDETSRRLLLNDSPVTPDQVINKAATIENLGLVTIDFVGLMVRGETTESSMAHVYQTLMLGAKELHCPILAISQLNKYVNGIPTPNHFPYTKAAWALSWLVATIYDPTKDFGTDEERDFRLPAVHNTAYVCVWKIRGGFRKHLEDNPGAIQIPFRPDKGWGERHHRWYSLKKV